MMIGGGAESGANPFGAPISAAANGFVGSGLTGSHKLVHDTFAADTSSEEGLTITAVAQKLQFKGLNAHQVREICEALVAEGHMYSTIDDEHYKSTGTLF